MKEILKNNKLSAVIIVVYIVLIIIKKDMAISAFGNSTYYLIEMAQILPVIFMITVSIDVLIPKEWIVKRLGKKSGVFGAAFALSFGSLSAGPIYAAFPIAKILHKKGASVSNIVVILSAWAVIKVPMLANEAKFLGPGFMAVRWVLTVLCIFTMGWIMEKMNMVIHDEKVSEKQSVVVKRDYCIGCTTCERGMPEIFGMKDGKAYVINPDIKLEHLNEDEKKQLHRMVNKCPLKAIEVIG